jgi:putative SOS response-associated peptidase YedK
MCGRYDLNAIGLELAARFGAIPPSTSDGASSMGVVSKLSAGWQPRYNIAPGQHNPVVVRDASGQNRLQLMKWGLVPAWSKEAKLPYSTINARAETVATKPAFRKPLVSQRCLVPATGYFEWVQDAYGATGGSVNEGSKARQGKQPYRIRLWGDSGGSGANEVSNLDGIFAFAGLYDIWQGPDGEELQTYTIVTTRANSALSAIHARMPVILPGDVEGAWLDRDNKDLDKLMSLLQPYSEEGLTAYPVSRLVNNPGREGRALIEPLNSLAA